MPDTLYCTARPDEATPTAAQIRETLGDLTREFEAWRRGMDDVLERIAAATGLPERVVRALEHLEPVEHPYAAPGTRAWQARSADGLRVTVLLSPGNTRPLIFWEPDADPADPG